jgi:hypothetical protein
MNSIILSLALMGGVEETKADQVIDDRLIVGYSHRVDRILKRAKWITEEKARKDQEREDWIQLQLLLY